jgi:integrase
MASIKFLLQSKSEMANIYIRFSINRNTILKRKTGYTVNPKSWDKAKGTPIAKSEYLKNIKLKLSNMAIQIEREYNNDSNNGILINGEWLERRIDIINNKKVAVDLELLSNYIEKYISDAPFKRNQKKELGLSQRRVKSLITFKNKILEYENEFFRSRKIRIKEIDIEFANNFVSWLQQKNYSTNYLGKNIDNLKAICFDAERSGILVSYQLKSIRSFTETKAPENIIYLSDSELKKIEGTKLKDEYLINARKWLLFGCYIGQRSSDLLKIKESDIKDGNNYKDNFSVRQQKTGKIVTIPLFSKAIEAISGGFPHKISTTKFNEYIKIVCEKAEIDEMTFGRIKETSRGATKQVTLPKYKLVSTHICRRSFATNFYNSGIYPTSHIMSVTGHSTEKMFLKYIGKTDDHNAKMMLEISKKHNEKQTT